MQAAAALTRTGGRDPLPADARYECLLKIAAGGMATVFVGRQRGKRGFSRLVAIKRAHAHLLDDDRFREALVAEAKLASQIRHPNVVSVLDIDEPSEELMLVMDYVEGASLSQLLTAAHKRGQRLPPGVALQIVMDACAGLQAAHELTGEGGQPLAIVHRDVSPQNILVGIDGHARIVDFGIAKWAESGTATATGLKGKFGYMAPEYIRDRTVDRRIDVFGLGVVLWESLTGERLFRGEGELATILQVTTTAAPRVSALSPEVPPSVDAVVERALEKDPARRFGSAQELSDALEREARDGGLVCSHAAVRATVEQLLGDVLEARRTVLRDLVASRVDESSRPTPRTDTSLLEQATVTADVAASEVTDARTVPLVRPPLAELPQPRPQRNNGIWWLGAGVVAFGAAALALIMRANWPASPPESEGSVARQPPPAVTGSPTVDGSPPASILPAGLPPAAPSGVPSATASTTHTVALPQRPTRPAKTAPVATTNAPTSPATATSHRPGLGY